MSYWKNRSFLRVADHPAEEINALILLAQQLKAEKKNRTEKALLTGKNVALIFDKTSTRTRCAFEVACFDQGANCTYIAPSQSQMGEKESIPDTAKVLGRFYDAIQFRGAGHYIVEELAKYAGVPVYNGLTNEFHPTQMLADLLTMKEHANKDWKDISFAYLGDARFNMGNSLLLAGALMGMDIRISAPKALQPSEKIIAEAKELAKKSGAQILITDHPELAVLNADFIHTDIWVSMGEDKNVFAERSALLMPYRVNPELMAKSNNPKVKFMHCLPSYHNRETALGEDFYQKYQLNGVEVDDAVFESSASIVFDQAENRLHTIKALLVATLSD